MILETKRIYLRKFIFEDLSNLHKIFSDEETMQYYPAPFTLDQTKAWISKNQMRYEKDGYGLWAICLKENNELIGDCGLVKQTVDDNEEVEIGYHINKEYWSQGFGSEAAIGCRDYGFYELGLNRLISIINPTNMPSIKVAEKMGFKKEKESFIFNKTHFIYSGKRENELQQEEIR